MCQNQLLVLILRIMKYFSTFSYCHMPVVVLQVNMLLMICHELTNNYRNNISYKFCKSTKLTKRHYSYSSGFFILAKQKSPQSDMFSTVLFPGDFFTVQFQFQIRTKPFFEELHFRFEFECQEFKRSVLSLIKSYLTVLISRKKGACL